MRLQYVISFKETALSVKIEEKGSRRILYWDTLSQLATEDDREALFLFRKILTRFSRTLETLAFQHIDIPWKDACSAMQAIAKTGRVRYNNAPLHCDWTVKAKMIWRGSGERIWALLHYKGEDIPLEMCEKVLPGWCIWQTHAFPLQSSVSWRWVEFFLKGPQGLENIQKKRFLEEEPPIEWIQNESVPQLFLMDTSGSLAHLAQENKEWEKDLIDVGYIRTIVGNAQYFCPEDKVSAALELLLDVGWEIFLSHKKRLYRQTKTEWELQGDGHSISARGTITFQEKEVGARLVSNALSKKSLWVEIDGSSAGLLDKKKGQVFEGTWIGETLKMGRELSFQLIPLLECHDTKWQQALFRTVLGFKEGGERQHKAAQSSFLGTLLPHQQKGLDWLWFLYTQGFSALLADEMGLGKTVQVLAFFSCLGTNLPVLIVAPASLVFQWKAEIEKFLQMPATVYTGVEDLAHCVITSYARLRSDERLAQIQWEVIVLDESHAIKTASTQTARAAYRLKGRFRIALSGTPMENRPEEIESQFRFLLPGLASVHQITPFILRRKKEELDLPEKMEQIAWVEMEKGQQALYDSYMHGIKNGLLEKVALDGTSMHRMEILEAILRLRQICTDPRLIGQELRGAKMERLFSDIEEALNEKRKILVYSQFSSMLKLVGKELNIPFLYLDGTLSQEERALQVQKFQQDSEVSLFLLSLKAGGVGLNLTAADYVLLLDPWWNDAVENQAIDRAHRIGQKKTVIAKRYITLGTIEEKMLQLKADKLKAAEELLSQGENFHWTEEDLLRLF
ncbi:MAG TPA: DEAD/DEAH box helicase [Chlamydiales bacterium]|nr:DEAD/DEAH box helicase [Chlamydiales bacterium]